MKAIKALKRLTKAEALLSNVIERYVTSEHSLQEVLQDAKASVIRAKEAVGQQASPGSRKDLGESWKTKRRDRQRLGNNRVAVTRHAETSKTQAPDQ